jgi:hypothetical protein
MDRSAGIQMSSLIKHEGGQNPAGMDANIFQSRVKRSVAKQVDGQLIDRSSLKPSDLVRFPLQQFVRLITAALHKRKKGGKFLPRPPGRRGRNAASRKLHRKSHCFSPHPTGSVFFFSFPEDIEPFPFDWFQEKKNSKKSGATLVTSPVGVSRPATIADVIGCVN